MAAGWRSQRFRDRFRPDGDPAMPGLLDERRRIPHLGHFSVSRGPVSDSGRGSRFGSRPTSRAGPHLWSLQRASPIALGLRCRRSRAAWHSAPRCRRTYGIQNPCPVRRGGHIRPALQRFGEVTPIAAHTEPPLSVLSQRAVVRRSLSFWR